MKRACGLLLALLVLAMPAATPVRAAEPEAGPDEEGISAYSVARLKIFEGSVWVRTPDSGEWEEYATNMPVSEMARINVPEGSEAELQFHGGQFVLLTGGTEVDVRKFDTDATVFGLRGGEIRFDLPAEDFSPVSVVLPGGGRTHFPVPGRYWLDVQDSGDTRLVVRSGEGSVSVEKGKYAVKTGQEAMIGRDVRVSAYSGQTEDAEAPRPPLSEEERKAGVPPAAAQELREYGEWVYSNEHGWVWRPRVATDWTPYYYGRWAWVSPYGWTWVSHEPWGWYPYHYGWWVADPFFGWVWSPFHSFVSVSFVFGHGHFFHFHRNAFFSPAKVRFVRDGRVVRWVPLRRGERFVRSGFTRSDARLARWDRPLERGRVFVRGDGDRGTREWRDFTAARGDRTSRADRVREVRVRSESDRRDGSGRGGAAVRQERSIRGGGSVRGGGAGRDDGSAVRPRTENSGDRQERDRGREFRGGDRNFRGGGGNFRGGGGRGRGSSLAPENRPRDTAPGFRQDRTRPSRAERSGREFRGASPPARMAAPPRTRGNFAGERRFSGPGPGRPVRMENAAGPRVRSGGGGNRAFIGGGGSRGFSGGGGLRSGGGGSRGFGGGGRGSGGRGFSGGGRR